MPVPLAQSNQQRSVMVVDDWIYRTYVLDGETPPGIVIERAAHLYKFAVKVRGITMRVLMLSREIAPKNIIPGIRPVCLRRR